MTPDATLEAVLFAAAKPLTLKQLTEYTHLGAEEISSVLEELERRLDKTQSGLQLLRHGKEVELVTRPEAADAISCLEHEELSGELTRPALEALTILAYRGPMTRAELEHIRGIQSALILRNLLLRGLVQETGEEKFGQPLLTVTVEFLHSLGLKRIELLPEFEALRNHTAVNDMLAECEHEQPRDKVPRQALNV